MPASPHKARLTVECSLEEKTYIKMLATSAHMTISEYFLSYVRPNLPTSKARKPNKKSLSPSRSKKPNKKTLDAHKEALEGKGETFENMDKFWRHLGVKRAPKS
jgi:hypothetical protein